MVKEAFQFLIKKCDDPKKIPDRVKSSATAPLKEAKDPLKIWEVAGPGWKKVLSDNEERCLRKFIGNFNTPKSKNVDELFHDVLGVRNISSNWKWRGMSRESTGKKLEEYVEIRGAIAHRTTYMKSVTKSMAEDYLHFVEKIVNITDNCVLEHMRDITGGLPWPTEEEVS